MSIPYSYTSGIKETTGAVRLQGVHLLEAEPIGAPRQARGTDVEESPSWITKLVFRTPSVR